MDPLVGARGLCVLFRLLPIPAMLLRRAVQAFSLFTASIHILRSFIVRVAKINLLSALYQSLALFFHKAESRPSLSSAPNSLCVISQSKSLWSLKAPLVLSLTAMAWPAITFVFLAASKPLARERCECETLRPLRWEVRSNSRAFTLLVLFGLCGEPK